MRIIVRDFFVLLNSGMRWISAEKPVILLYAWMSFIFHKRYAILSWVPLNMVTFSVNDVIQLRRQNVPREPIRSRLMRSINYDDRSITLWQTSFVLTIIGSQNFSRVWPCSALVIFSRLWHRQDQFSKYAFGQIPENARTFVCYHRISRRAAFADQTTLMVHKENVLYNILVRGQSFIILPTRSERTDLCSICEDVVHTTLKNERFFS